MNLHGDNLNSTDELNACINIYLYLVQIYAYKFLERIPTIEIYELFSYL